MEKSAKREMNTYYNERASEFDQFYLEGMGPASIKNQELYKNETLELKRIIEREIRGNLIYDICCGTAFWLPSYYKNVDRIILADQSENMVSKAGARAVTLGCQNKCSFHVMDAFSIGKFSKPASAFLIGFFISHLTLEQEKSFFKIMKKMIEPDGKILILDSTWNDEREKVRNREGLQERTLNNGENFTIYKKYFTINDLEQIAERENMTLTVEFFGDTFFAAVFKAEGNNGK